MADNSKQSSGDTLSTVLSSVFTTSSDSYEPHSEEAQEIEKNNKKQMQRNAISITNYFISTNTKSYLGMMNTWYWIIDLLHTLPQIPANNIKLSLVKIKIDDSFNRLREQFGMSHVRTSNIFSSTVLRLAHMLQTLIYLMCHRRTNSFFRYS